MMIQTHFNNIISTKILTSVKLQYIVVKRGPPFLKAI